MKKGRVIYVKGEDISVLEADDSTIQKLIGVRSIKQTPDGFAIVHSAELMNTEGEVACALVAELIGRHITGQAIICKCSSIDNNNIDLVPLQITDINALSHRVRLPNDIIKAFQ